MRRPVGVGGMDGGLLQAPVNLPPVVNAIVLVEAINVESTPVANVRDTTFQQYVVDSCRGWLWRGIRQGCILFQHGGDAGDRGHVAEARAQVDVKVTAQGVRFH